MIYFDSAATTLQKPRNVYKAVEAALKCCGNPGRSGHKAAMKAASVIYDCREAAASLFSVDEPERVVLTGNATHALNVAIKSQLANGGHVVVSGYEHNSVMRPLEAMKNVSYTVASSPLFDPDAALRAIGDAMRNDTVCVICTHVSNVFGFVLPIERIDDMCRRRGVRLIVDASQSAGVLRLDASRLKATAYICMPGHKSLYGPTGTGILLCCGDDERKSLIEGGTGSRSMELAQPDMLPDVFESGTPNVCGAAGLCEGIRFVERIGIEAIEHKERSLAERLADRLYGVRGIKMYTGSDAHCGPVSLTLEGMTSEELCGMLADKGFCLRGGLHCSPLAHQTVGTAAEGTARVSFSWFNSPHEVDLLAREIRKTVSEM